MTSQPRPVSRRQFGGFAAFGLAAVAMPVCRPTPAAADPFAPYTATPGSVNQHVAAPEWFQDAKFGVYWHWGAFTTPEYHNEWYPRFMYQDGGVRQHHTATYGDPNTVFGYNKFIDGGVDLAGRPVKFAPKLKSAGGQFDPAEWARIIKNSGARFAGPVAEHHDGFSMWDSQVNEWNSVDKGPQLNLVKLFTDAIRAEGMKVLIAMHHAFNYHGFYAEVPPQTDPSLQKLFGQLPRAVEDQLWLDKNKEVIDQARPDILWQDSTMEEVPEATRDAFSAYYYNQAHAWGSDVVVTYKIGDHLDEPGWVADYERGGPADITTPHWLTDDSLSTSSWSYTTGMGYLSGKAMLHSLIDRVSKGGNMLLNIAPTKEGVIPAGQIDILNAIGAHLGRNGESIYSTRPWVVYGEGPNRAGGGSYTANLVGGPTDIRYTRDKASRVLYATVLGWPGNNGTLTLGKLGQNRIDLSGLQSVQLIGATAGSYTNVAYTQDGTGLRITMPGSAPVAADAYVVKLTFAGAIPTPLSGSVARVYQHTSFQGAVAELPVGRFGVSALVARGMADSSVSSYRIADGLQMLAYTQDAFAGAAWYLTGADADLRTSGRNDVIRSIIVRPDPARWFNLTNVVNGLVLDSGGPAGAEPSLKLWSPGSSTNLQFQFGDLGGGYFKIINRTNGLAVDGLGATGNGSVVGQTTYANLTSQQWLISDVGGDSLILRNRATGLVLDGGGGVASGSRAKQWTNDGSRNLRWTITAV